MEHGLYVRSENELRGCSSTPLRRIIEAAVGATSRTITWLAPISSPCSSCVLNVRPAAKMESFIALVTMRMSPVSALSRAVSAFAAST